MIEQLGGLSPAVESAMRVLVESRAVARLRAGDHTLWAGVAVEITDRLGWLGEPARMRAQLDELRGFASAARNDGARRSVWCGMGGSSLFPQVLRQAFGVAAEGVDLQVLDTSHPAAVLRATRASPASQTLWCFASKSGGTIETRCHLDFFSAFDPEPSRFVAVTDAGSGLDALAIERDFRSVFHANPDIGGRFSALSHFGLLPAALMGIDVTALLDGAETMAEACQAADGPAVRLAAVLGACALAGRDKCTLVLPDEMSAFGLWIEQLVAESTGKHATGILPVVGEPLGDPQVYGDDRVFVAYGDASALDGLAAAGHPVVELGPIEPTSLGAEVYRWEVAVALVCSLLHVNPFDQPDVDAAKIATGDVLAGGTGSIPTLPPRHVLDSVQPGGFLSIQAFVDPDGPALPALAAARMALRDRLHVPVTLDLGPRYLHSTGQLQKGGPPGGVFLQVVDAGVEDLPIPGRPYGFGTLLTAQADGDHLALASLGRPVARVAIDDLLAVAAL